MTSLPPRSAVKTVSTHRETVIGTTSRHARMGVQQRSASHFYSRAQHFDSQYVAKRPISRSKMGRFRLRNGPFCSTKWAVSQINTAAPRFAAWLHAAHNRTSEEPHTALSPLLNCTTYTPWWAADTGTTARSVPSGKSAAATKRASHLYTLTVNLLRDGASRLTTTWPSATDTAALSG